MYAGDSAMDPVGVGVSSTGSQNRAWACGCGSLLIQLGSLSIPTTHLSRTGMARTHSYLTVTRTGTC
jgi:hypothetical protein